VISIRTLLVACACASSAAVSSAQTPADVRRDAQVHLGPVYATPRFAVKEFGIDSNVFNNADEKRDFTFTLAPAADVWIPFGRRGLFTTTVGSDVVYYQRYASERSINPDVRVRGDLFLGRITPFVEAGYLRSRQRPNFEIDVRSLRQERSLTAGVDVRLFSKIAVGMSARYRPLTFAADATFNDVNLQETMNRTTTTVSLVGRYAATPLTTFVLRAETARDRFEFSPLRNADSVTLVPGVEFEPLALISGSAHVGFRRFTPDSPSLEPFSGMVADTSLSYTLQGTTKFTVSASRDLTYSYERVQPYFVVSRYGLAVRRQIVGAFDGTATVQRERYRYRDLLLPGSRPSDIDRVDTTSAWGGSLGYRLGRTMRAGIGVTYRERASNSNRFRDYRGLRFITTLDYDF
jgi:hypothetical protein